MISVILLILTVVLLIIGGVLGFHRGILKEGVRAVLWMVLFACSCFFIPQIADYLPLLIAEKFELTAVDVEQMVSSLLNKVDILKRETYLILPFAGFVRTLISPLIVSAFFWLSGLVSWILYLLVSLFLRKKEEQKKMVSGIAGLVLGIVLALFSGAVTVYPVAAASSAVREGDSDQMLCKEFTPIKIVAEAYEGSVVKMVYQFTGTEMLGASLHNAVNSMVVSEDTYNIWNELPQLINLGAEGWQTYSVITGKTEDTLQEHTHPLLNAYFSLDFVSEENKVLLLKRMKSLAGTSMNDSMAGILLNWLEVQNKDQIINDVMAYAYVYDVLNQEGILDAVLTGNGMPMLSEEAGKAVTDTLFTISNAQKVVPEFINLIYASVMSGAEKNLVQTENLTWNDETKEEISKVVSVICKVSSVMGHADSMSVEEKKTVLDAIKELKENKAVGKENYAALLKAIMGML